jgi:GNAT superfamily N-acetyltransferase
MTMWDVIIPDSGDAEMLEGLFALQCAVHSADQSDAPGPERPTAEALESGPGSARRVVLARDGRPVGFLTMSLPQKDNLHRATLHIMVHPSARRHGIGRALMAEADRIATENGRDTMVGIVHTAYEGGPSRPVAGAAFAEASGFTVANTEIRSRASTTPVAAEDGLLDAAVAASADYDMIRWTGSEPEGTLEEVAALHSTFSMEAPMGQLRLQRSTVTADQLRQAGEKAEASGTFRCGVVARHRGTGAAVGNTFIVVKPDPEPHGDQLITLVSPEHRGHRLSMRLKIENLRQLRERRPDVAWVWTENAESNVPMRRVNEQLGFRPVDYALRYQRTTA